MVDYLAAAVKSFKKQRKKAASALEHLVAQISERKAEIAKLDLSLAGLEKIVSPTKRGRPTKGKPGRRPYKMSQAQKDAIRRGKARAKREREAKAKSRKKASKPVAPIV
jgi:hypothetical protein